MKRERHARTPDSVLLDARLSSDAKVVFGVLSRHAFKGGNVYLGQRRIAEMLDWSQSRISRVIRELRGAAHIEVAERKRGERAGYFLASNIFKPREKKAAAEKRQLSPTLRYARAFVDNSAS